jgi:hypothetical protein
LEIRLGAAMLPLPLHGLPLRFFARRHVLALWLEPF